jgi:hypothetical protein
MPFAGASRASIQGIARLELAKGFIPTLDYAFSSPAKQAFGVDLFIAPPSWQSVLCHSSVSNCFNSTRRFAQGFAPRGAKPLLASEKDNLYRPRVPLRVLKLISHLFTMEQTRVWERCNLPAILSTEHRWGWHGAVSAPEVKGLCGPLRFVCLVASWRFTLSNTSAPPTPLRDTRP